MTTAELRITTQETDHAAEAHATLRAFVPMLEDLSPSDQIAHAQVHATLFVGQAIERQTDEMELAREQRSVDAAAAERPGRDVYTWEHRTYTIVVGSLIPGLLWAVDVYCSADPESGEGPSRIWSFGSLRRAIPRGRQLADERADEDAELANEQQAAAGPLGW